MVRLVAEDAIYVVAFVAALTWLTLERRDKVELAVQVVVGVLVVAVLVKVAGALHTDPRPFVVHPSLTPLFPHPPDNGFPSDHTALAATVSLLVLLYRPFVGLGLLGLTVALGAARVAAHVHHVQDIAAGLVLGALAAAVAVGVWTLVAPRFETASKREVVRK